MNNSKDMVADLTYALKVLANCLAYEHGCGASSERLLDDVEYAMKIAVKYAGWQPQVKDWKERMGFEIMEIEDGEDLE